MREYGFSLSRILPYKDRNYDSFLIRKNMGQWKPLFSHLLCTLNKQEAHFRLMFLFYTSWKQQTFPIAFRGNRKGKLFQNVFNYSKMYLFEPNLQKQIPQNICLWRFTKINSTKCCRILILKDEFHKILGKLSSFLTLCPKCAKISTTFKSKNNCKKIDTVMKNDFAIWIFAVFSFKTIMKLRSKLVYSCLVLSLSL